MLPPETVILDGQIHRFRTSARRGARNKTGWYVAFSDGVPAGAFGDWATGDDHQWCASIGRSLSPEEERARSLRLAEAHAVREQERRAAYGRTASVCAEIWEQAEAAPADHPYLTRKGIGPNGLRVTGDGRLIAPLYIEGALASLQYIDAAGGKLYHASGATKGACAVIGALDGARTLYLAEGYATAATIHEATGQPVVVAYSAANLVPVAELLTERAPLPVIIVADNDRSGVGQRYAEQAAARTGCRYVLPPGEGDANDYARSGGDLRALLEPPASGWLIPASELISQPAPLRWLIKGWLPQQSLAMVFGPSGSGKTFTVLDMCLRIASGAAHWAGRRVTPAPVVLLAGEGHHGLRARIAAWVERHRPEGPVRLWASSSGCDLDSDEGYLRVRDAVRALPEPPRLIVVDTLHRFLAGSENDAQDARRMIVACAKLQEEFLATIILVHHSGASEETQGRARGSTAWLGAVDAQIGVTTNPDGMIIRAHKMKDAEAPAQLRARLEAVTIPGWEDEDGEPVSSVVLSEPTEEQPEPPRERRPTALSDALRSWERAWWASGAEDREGRPYLSRAALEAWAREHGVSRRACRADGDGMVGHMLSAGAMTPHEHGWLLSEGPDALALIAARSAQ
jgi:phage/plasmid primase-like uncharacterized protein/KaiC/GvpD/RAD55 family RecA-like ATPase